MSQLPPTDLPQVPRLPEGVTLTRKDFQSSMDVRWCPGCGDYAILASIQKVMPTLGIPKENFVFVSGIGCSSRFPYYMNTYGFHTIHGRAPTIATGLKLTRPDLSVWIVTGDGDGLSIGGNHLIHAIRRNVDVNILLFNNRIYGLTKGQYSPTSEMGKQTKSSPFGTIDLPLRPVQMALASGCTFVARVLDVDQKGLTEVLTRAAQHKGASFVEIYQTCVVFNEDSYSLFRDKESKAESSFWLEHGKPLLFGPNRDRGIKMDGIRPKVVKVGGPDGVPEGEILCHDEQDSTLAYMLSLFREPLEPVPFGVFRCETVTNYEELAWAQEARARKRLGDGDLRKLYDEGDTWTVEENGQMHE